MLQGACGLLQTWFVAPATRMAPDLTYAQLVPGTGRGGGIVDLSYQTTTLDLLDAVALVLGSCGRDTQAGVAAWLGLLAAWLASSSWGAYVATFPNNHATQYTVRVALLVIQSVCDSIRH